MFYFQWQNTALSGNSIVVFSPNEIWDQMQDIGLQTKILYCNLKLECKEAV